MQIQSQDGDVYLPELQLWLDPHRARTGPERVFVSHAHSDHTGRHREVILTPPTARFMQMRVGGQRVEHALAWGEKRGFETERRRWGITLLPAGHILGSAMALVEYEGESLLYTGDFKLSPGPLAERCEPRKADQLVMETTFGRPEYRFPQAEEVMRDLVRFCHETLTAGAVPVLLAYSLGKSQELLHGLANTGLGMVVHEEILRLNRVHEEFGRRLPPCRRWDGAAAAGSVIICPPGTRRLAALRAGGKVRVAAATGWAVDRGCRYRLGCDAVFPLSDHADYDELLALVRRVAPGRIHTVHGFAADYAGTLRELGYNVSALGLEEQLTLGLGLIRNVR